MPLSHRRSLIDVPDKQQVQVQEEQEEEQTVRGCSLGHRRLCLLGDCRLRIGWRRMLWLLLLIRICALIRPRPGCRFRDRLIIRRNRTRRLRRGILRRDSFFFFFFSLTLSFFSFSFSFFPSPFALMPRICYKRKRLSKLSPFSFLFLFLFPPLFIQSRGCSCLAL